MNKLITLPIDIKDVLVITLLARRVNIKDIEPGEDYQLTWDDMEDARMLAIEGKHIKRISLENGSPNYENTILIEYTERKSKSWVGTILPITLTTLTGQTIILDLTQDPYKVCLMLDDYPTKKGPDYNVWDSKK